MAATKTPVASTHIPNADFISLYAKNAQLTIVQAHAAIAALPVTMLQLLVQPGSQTIELPQLGTFEEHRRKGTTPPALGSIPYDTPDISFRSSSNFKKGLAVKSNTLLPDGTTRQLTLEEYDKVLAYQDSLPD